MNFAAVIIFNLTSKIYETFKTKIFKQLFYAKNKH